MPHEAPCPPFGGHKEARTGGPGGFAANERVVDVRGLRKRYGGVTAVDGIDLGIRRGEVFGLLGPNGGPG